MSLRESLRRATSGPELQVARPSACNTQLGAAEDATAHAIATQQQPAEPRQSSRADATARATDVQPGTRNRATSGPELQVARPSACNTQLPSLTAPRAWPKLALVINRTCDLRGDDTGSRATLLTECAAQSLADQADLLEHFNKQAAAWDHATGRNTY